MRTELFLLTVVLSYLIGSFPTAYVVGRLNRVNIFEVGSGNMGTANTVRALGLRWGLLVWAIDILKGVIAVLLARAILYPYLGWANIIGGLVPIIGHNWSFFATLLTGTIRGGKGAAIWWGTFIMMAPAYVIAGVALVFGGIIALTRYISLGVLTSVAVGVLWLLVLIGQGELPTIYALYATLAALLIFVRHRENIERLLAGKERRLGERA